MDEKRIAEIKARAEAATPAPWKMVPRAALPFLPTRDHVADVDGHEVQPARDGILGDQTADADFIAHAREDVPFLLEQLERAQRDVAVAADDAEADLKEVLRLKSALAASEAAAGAMRAALEKIDQGLDDAGENPYIYGEVTARDEAQAALATDAGRGWLSPEEAERLRKDCARLAKEAGYPKPGRVLEPADAQAHHLKQAAGSPFAPVGYVTEEECARRCREVGEALEAEFMKRINEMGIDLSAIIERVAKGAP